MKEKEYEQFCGSLKAFLKGAKVRCLDGTFFFDPRLPYKPEEIRLPDKGEVYTVRLVVETFGGIPGVLLEEIINEEFSHIDPNDGTKRVMCEPIFTLLRFETF